MSKPFSLFDAWVYSKLFANVPLNGELASVSAEWGPLASLLDTMPPSDAQGRLARSDISACGPCRALAGHSRR